MSYSRNTRLRFMCHCDANPSCEWCGGKGYHHAASLQVFELEEIKHQINQLIETKTKGSNQST